MHDKILDQVSLDLMSIPPLIFRATRKKVIKSSLADIELNITHHHFEIIRILQEEGPLHIAEIGNRLQISKAQMTQLIDKLVELKIVERNSDESDRRIINISLTDYGNIFVQEKKHRIVQEIRDTISYLSDKDLADLSFSLRKLNEILSKLN